MFDNAIVDGNAIVCDNALVHGEAEVSDNALVCDNAEVFGHAEIMGHAGASDNAKVFEEAVIFGYGKVLENSVVGGYNRIYGNIYRGNVVAKDDNYNTLIDKANKIIFNGKELKELNNLRKLTLYTPYDYLNYIVSHSTKFEYLFSKLFTRLLGSSKEKSEALRANSDAQVDFVNALANPDLIKLDDKQRYLVAIGDKKYNQYVISIVGGGFRIENKDEYIGLDTDFLLSLDDVKRAEKYLGVTGLVDIWNKESEAHTKAND